MNNTQHKLCPFCGGTGIEGKTLRNGYKDGDLEAYAYFIHCHACAAQGGWSKSSHTGAWMLWDMRVVIGEDKNVSRN